MTDTHFLILLAAVVVMAVLRVGLLPTLRSLTLGLVSVGLDKAEG